ncbi:MAG: SDR family NAD(P)-dependent oxidoreductase [Gemmatimonadota bacterium]
MPNPFPYTHAAITGASSGLGEGVARRLAARGVAVTLMARRVGHLEALASDLEAQGGRAASAPCDVSNRGEVHAALTLGEQRFGPVDLLIANAGVGHLTPAQGLDAAAVEHVFQVNTLGMVYAVEAVLPGMLSAGRGRLVGISSLAGIRGLPGSSAYCGSKAAMNAFLESLRVELRGTGVGVTIVSPGFIRTPMTAHRNHPMPFLMDLDPAVDRIVRDMERGRSSSYFPMSLAALVRLGRFLPDGIYDALLSRVGSRRG